eukprot:scaffold516_cov401-Prasinococcus_capsulatus_cf.AAC.18
MTAPRPSVPDGSSHDLTWAATADARTPVELHCKMSGQPRARAMADAGFLATTSADHAERPQ